MPSDKKLGTLKATINEMAKESYANFMKTPEGIKYGKNIGFDDYLAQFKTSLFVTASIYDKISKCENQSFTFTNASGKTLELKLENLNENSLRFIVESISNGGVAYGRVGTTTNREKFASFLKRLVSKPDDSAFVQSKSDLERQKKLDAGFTNLMAFTNKEIYDQFIAAGYKPTTANKKEGNVELLMLPLFVQSFVAREIISMEKIASKSVGHIPSDVWYVASPVRREVPPVKDRKGLPVTIQVESRAIAALFQKSITPDFITETCQAAEKINWGGMTGTQEKQIMDAWKGIWEKGTIYTTPDGKTYTGLQGLLTDQESISTRMGPGQHAITITKPSGEKMTLQWLQDIAGTTFDISLRGNGNEYIGHIQATLTPDKQQCTATLEIPGISGTFHSTQEYNADTKAYTFHNFGFDASYGKRGTDKTTIRLDGLDLNTDNFRERGGEIYFTSKDGKKEYALGDALNDKKAMNALLGVIGDNPNLAITFGSGDFTGTFNADKSIVDGRFSATGMVDLGKSGTAGINLTNSQLVISGKDAMLLVNGTQLISVQSISGEETSKKMQTKALDLYRKIADGLEKRSLDPIYAIDTKQLINEFMYMYKEGIKSGDITFGTLDINMGGILGTIVGTNKIAQLSSQVGKDLGNDLRVIITPKNIEYLSDAIERLDAIENDPAFGKWSDKYNSTAKEIVLTAGNWVFGDVQAGINTLLLLNGMADNKIFELNKGISAVIRENNENLINTKIKLGVFAKKEVNFKNITVTGVVGIQEKTTGFSFDPAGQRASLYLTRQGLVAGAEITRTFKPIAVGKGNVFFGLQGSVTGEVGKIKDIGIASRGSESVVWKDQKMIANPFANGNVSAASTMTYLDEKQEIAITTRILVVPSVRLEDIAFENGDCSIKNAIVPYAKPEFIAGYQRRIGENASAGFRISGIPGTEFSQGGNFQFKAGKGTIGLTATHTNASLGPNYSKSYFTTGINYSTLLYGAPVKVYVNARDIKNVTIGAEFRLR